MAVTDELCRSFLDLWWHFDPAAATQAGIPGHDGRLGAFDPVSIREHVAAFRSIAGAVEDLEVEETADEIDRTALLDHLRVLLFRFEREHPYERNPALWIEHLAVAFEGLLARPQGDEESAAAALDRLHGLPRFIADARETLRQPPLFLVETALAMLPPLSELLEQVATRFVRQEGEGAAALTEAHAALERMGRALRQPEADPDPHAAAIGEDEVDRRLHHEHASIHNAAEVWRGALRLAAEVEREVTVIAEGIDPSVPWQDLYGLQRGDGAVWSELAAELADAIQAARQFVESRGLSATAAPLDVAELSAPRLVLEPIAEYRPGNLATRAGLLAGDFDRAALPWLAARLGVPGVHLHRSRTDMLEGVVRRNLSATSTPLGWGLYAQELMAELGYQPDPEARLVERVLFLRDVHLAIVDLGLHTRQLTPEAAMAHLEQKLPTDRRTALADVRRLACRPTSSTAAILGRQELRRLRQDAGAAHGAGYGLEDFHLELFAYGGLPVPLIRWGMALDA